jgi:hypothetical protein
MEQIRFSGLPPLGMLSRRNTHEAVAENAKVETDESNKKRV